MLTVSTDLQAAQPLQRARTPETSGMQLQDTSRELRQGEEAAEATVAAVTTAASVAAAAAAAAVIAAAGPQVQAQLQVRAVPQIGGSLQDCQPFHCCVSVQGQRCTYAVQWRPAARVGVIAYVQWQLAVAAALLRQPCTA